MDRIKQYSTKKTVANPFIYNNQYCGFWEETDVQKEAGAPIEDLVVEEVEVVNQGTLTETLISKKNPRNK